MNEVTLNYDDEKGSSSKIQLESNPMQVRIIDENGKLLHLFQLMEIDQYFETPEIDNSSKSFSIRWRDYKEKFRK